MIPQDFQRTHIHFPKSLLSDLNMRVRHQEDIYRPSFPPSWEVRPRDDLQERVAEERQRTRAGDGGGSGRGNPPVPRTTNTQNSTVAAEDLAHLHPLIKAAEVCRKSNDSGDNGGSRDLVGRPPHSRQVQQPGDGQELSMLESPMWQMKIWRAV